MSLLRAALFVLLMTACTTPSPGPTPTATTAPLSGQIDIQYPPDGAQLYAEIIRISGTIAGVPAKSFEVRVIGPDDTILNRVAVETLAGEWQIGLLNDYNGEPIEATIVAAPVTGSGLYDAVLVQLAGLDQRPADFRASLSMPAHESTVGGEGFELAGLVSGTEPVILRLASTEGRLLDETSIAAAPAFGIDVIPWRAELDTSGYTGPAIVELLAEDRTIATHNITIVENAG